MIGSEQTVPSHTCAAGLPPIMPLPKAGWFAGTDASGANVSTTGSATLSFDQDVARIGGSGRDESNPARLPRCSLVTNPFRDLNPEWDVWLGRPSTRPAPDYPCQITFGTAP